MSVTVRAMDVIEEALVCHLVEEGIAPQQARRVSESVCLRLRDEFGACRIYVPGVYRTAKQSAILADLANGLSDQEVADRNSCARATVWRARKKAQQRR